MFACRKGMENNKVSAYWFARVLYYDNLVLSERVYTNVSRGSWEIYCFLTKIKVSLSGVILPFEDVRAVFCFVLRDKPLFVKWKAK